MIHHLFEQIELLRDIAIAANVFTLCDDFSCSFIVGLRRENFGILASHSLELSPYFLTVLFNFIKACFPGPDFKEPFSQLLVQLFLFLAVDRLSQLYNPFVRELTAFFIDDFDDAVHDIKLVYDLLLEYDGPIAINPEF